MRGNKGRQDYSRVYKKNLKVDNNANLLKGNNKYKSNFVVSLITSFDSSHEHFQRTPRQILLPLIDNQNSSNDFKPTRKKAQKNEVTLFHSPDCLEDSYSFPLNNYNDGSTRQYKYSNKKKKKRKKKNPIVKEFNDHCNIDWSEIEDFKLVIEKVPKESNYINKKDNKLEKECSIFLKGSESLHNLVPNISPENKVKYLVGQGNLIKNEMVTEKETLHGCEIIDSLSSANNRDLATIHIRPNELTREDDSLDAKQISKNKSQSLDRESTFFHFLRTTCKSRKVLTTSTPNVTPGKFCGSNADAYCICQKISSNCKMTDECVVPLTDSLKKLEINQQKLIKCSISNVPLSSTCNSLSSRSHNPSSVGASPKKLYNDRNENEPNQPKLQIPANNSCSSFHENLSLLPVGKPKENSSTDLYSVQSNYSQQLFDTLSLARFSLEKNNSKRETLVSRNILYEKISLQSDELHNDDDFPNDTKISLAHCVSDGAALHQNVLSSDENYIEDDKNMPLQFALSSLHKDICGVISETRNRVYISSSKTEKDLDVVNNQDFPSSNNLENDNEYECLHLLHFKTPYNSGEKNAVTDGKSPLIHCMSNDAVCENLWSSNKNVIQDCEDASLFSVMSAVHENSYDTNSELNDKSFASRDGDLDLSIGQNQSLLCPLSSSLKSGIECDVTKLCHFELLQRNICSTDEYLICDGKSPLMSQELIRNVSYSGSSPESIFHDKKDRVQCFDLHENGINSINENRNRTSNSLIEDGLNLFMGESQDLVSSASRQLKNSIESERNITDLCQFKSYCEFVSFASNISSCKDDLKELLKIANIDSAGTLETLLHKENFIEEHANIVVLILCNQKAIIPFTDVITPEMMPNVSKIGEGSYGEVFCYESEDTKHVYKIIPIEGSVVINEEKQKSYLEVLSEILISLELSILSNPSSNMTSNFVRVNRVYCAYGRYPDDLLERWDRYAETKESGNERPDIFPEDQKFIIFEFAYGGIDLEAVQLKNATEAKSVFQQVAFALAVAEQALEFEHRDLHWGNILIASTKQEKIEYNFQGERFLLPAYGVFVSIIDFTFSFIRKDGCIIFTSLADDSTLFTGEGDYQFDIYRLMKEDNGNDWETFHPYSNILWLDYLLKKLLTEMKFKNYKKHRISKLQLQKWEKSIRTYKSVTDFVVDSEFFQSSKL